MRNRPHAVTCARAARWLYPALDGALRAAERAALDRHLDSCPACRQLADREAAFRARLARLCAEPPPAPAALHARLRAALMPRPRTGEPIGPEALAPRFARLRRLLSAGSAPQPPAGAAPGGASWGRLAAAVAVAAALAAVLAEPLVRTRAATPALVMSVAAQQAALAEGRLPLEITSGSSAEVADWLRPRLGFPVELPPLVGDDVEVVGARLTELAAAEAAAVLYRVDGREVALFTFPAAVLRRPESSGGTPTRELALDGHRFRHYRVGHLTVTLWERGPIGYALAVPADVAAGRGCAVCHVGEENRRLERALAPGLVR